jgi:RNA polymerase sporulation-specific sigma factor
VPALESEGERAVGSGVAARVTVELQSTTDEELVARFQEGHQDAVNLLLERYRNFARMKARSYFLAGADKDDIVQEGMIGLYKAIRDFSFERETSFRAFAEVCITRQIITAVKTATRQKHVPLNTYVSLTKPIAGEEDPDWALQDVLEAPQVTDPADLVISHDELRSIKLAFAEILSDFEAEVLHMYVEGKSYQEIGAHLGRHVKSIDNALQRIKRKVELHLKGREEAGGRGEHGRAGREPVAQAGEETRARSRPEGAARGPSSRRR